MKKLLIFFAIVCVAAPAVVEAECLRGVRRVSKLVLLGGSTISREAWEAAFGDVMRAREYPWDGEAERKSEVGNSETRRN